MHSIGSLGPKVLLLCRQQSLCLVWADVQADVSLCWAHRSFCWFCHALAHLNPKSNFPKFSDRQVSGQTAQTQIRLLLDQGLPCLQFPLHRLDALL